MDSSADDYPNELGRSVPVFVFWIACVCFAVCIVRCFGGYCHSGRREEDQSENDGDTPTLKETIKEVERRKTLIHCFQRNQVTMKVKAEELKSEYRKDQDYDGDSAATLKKPSDHEGSLDKDLEIGTSRSDPNQNVAGELLGVSPALEIFCEEDFGILDLPRKHYPRAVPNVCAICLEAYKPDETVVWSSNIDCSHAFHQDCILDCLMVELKVKDTVPCPCCRQDFMAFSFSEADEKGASDAEELNATVADRTHMVEENV